MYIAFLTIIFIQALVIGFLLYNSYKTKTDGTISIHEQDDHVTVSIDMGDTDVSRVRNQKRVVLDVDKGSAPRT